MKKIITLSIIFLSLIFSFSFSPDHASATVGGPTYISAIAYKAAENSVYYKVHDNGGRGCPPIVHRLDLTTLKDSEVKTCTEVEQEFLGGDYDAGMQRYNQFVSDTFRDLQYLGSVSLTKNHISVGVEFLSEHREEDWVIYSDFRATLKQDNKQLATINFRGCAKDQPNIFEGYMIPNSSQMIVLLSNKGDCFEGGYVREGLQIVKGVKYYDTTIIRNYKEPSATEPNQGNSIAYAGRNSDVDNDADTTNTTASPKNTTLIVTVIAVLLIGTLVGFVIAKKK